jgi:nitrogenase-associated protein
MSEVVFYEKPGCITNARQKQLLAAHGHRLAVRDLLCEPWSRERLRNFFGNRSVPDWFNRSAPRIRDGDLDIDSLDADQALTLMLADPLLIRRPLLETTAGRCAGFEPGPLLDLLGIRLTSDDSIDRCSRTSSACDSAPEADKSGFPTGCRHEAFR